jgi:putative membrane protein
MKKTAALALFILLLVMTAGTASGETGGGKAYSPIGTVVKDETVYVNLAGDGTVQQMSVVNRLETPEDGTYTDYGSYKQVTNLTNEAIPNVNGDKISWNLDADAQGFYYQGALQGGEPPFLFAVKYTLNGADTQAKDLIGKSGAVKMTLKALPNAKAKEYYRKNYMCQIQAELDLDKCGNIDAPKGNSVVAGKTRTVSFMALPEKEAEFTIGLDARDFAFGGFTITALPFDAGKMIDVDTKDLNDGIDDMEDGVDDMIDGTEDLRDGLKDLADGMGDLASGAKDARSGLKTYKKGLQDYTGGVSQLYGNAVKIAKGLSDLKANAEDLKNGYAGLKSGVKGVFSALSAGAPPELAGQISYLSDKLDAYGEGLNAFLNGVGSIFAGMDALCDGIKKLDKNGGKLIPGLTSIVNGMGELTDGLTKAASEMKKLPNEVKKLINGQKDLKDGIAEARDKFDDFTMGDASAKPVSFASDKNSVRSVQFIYKTEEIEKDEDEKEAPASADKEKGFFEKFTDLFK